MADRNQTINNRAIVSPLGLAWLRERSDRGPVRLIANGRKSHPVGSYVSAKSRRALQWESRNELHDFWRAEICNSVTRSWDQPHTLVVVLDGKKYRYTPDRLDLLADGCLEVVEVKDIFEAEEDPHYAFKLHLASVVYQANGYAFRIVEREEIEQQPAFDAIDRIQSRRLTAITALDIVRLHDLFADCRARPWGEVQEFFSGGPCGFATISALIVHRRLGFDPMGGLSPEAPLRLLIKAKPADA